MITIIGYLEDFAFQNIPCTLNEFGGEYFAKHGGDSAVWKVVAYNLKEMGQPGATEFIQQCKNALHLKRINEPDWKARFIDGYAKNCEKVFNVSATKG